MKTVCPKCDVALLLLHFRDVEVDYCERCRGIWLDAGELEALAGNALLSLGQTAGIPTRYLCPRCDKALVQITVPGSTLQLDRCPAGHGLWFDGGELEQMLEVIPGTELLKDIFAFKPKT